MPKGEGFYEHSELQHGMSSFALRTAVKNTARIKKELTNANDHIINNQHNIKAIGGLPIGATQGQVHT